MFSYLWTQSRQNTQGVRFVDSHTGGEPTRIIVSGGPDLGTGTLEQRLEFFKNTSMSSARPWFWNRGVLRNWSAACLSNPMKRTARRGIVFFNNVGMLGNVRAWNHRIGRHLAHLGRDRNRPTPDRYARRLVVFELEQDGWVSVGKRSELPLRQ